jgi:hypothetical protein
MRLLKRFQVVILTVAITVTSSVAQNGKKPITSRTKAQAGLVSGRVFGITEEGDIKPARFARVYLFQRYGPAVEPNDRDYNESAAHEWLSERYNAIVSVIQEKTSQFERDRSIESKALSCRRDLLTYDKATIETL